MYLLIISEEIGKCLGERDDPWIDVSLPHQLFLSLAKLTEEHMGGCTGAVRIDHIYKSMLLT